MTVDGASAVRRRLGASWIVPDPGRDLLRRTRWPRRSTSPSTTARRSGLNLDAYTAIPAAEGFADALRRSLTLAVLTVLGALAITVPAMLAVTLRLPRLRPVIEGLSLIPLVIPPIALVVGVRDMLSLGPDQLAGTPLGDVLVSSQDIDLPWILVVVYIVLALPFVYRSLDAGLRAIDVRTLVEAARGLGANWATIVFRVLLPNLRTAALGAAFLTIALVLGEYTVSRVLLFDTLPTWLVKISGANCPPFRGGQCGEPGVHLAAAARHIVRRPSSHHSEVLMTAPTSTSSHTAGSAVVPGTAHGHGVVMSGLVRRFGDVTALAGLNLTLAPGELVALLGPSGSGKTTALRVLAGFEQPDHGTVAVDGLDITHQPANRRGMGMVFQAFSLFPNLSVSDNVAFGLRVRGASGSARRSRAGELLELVGLSSTADRYPHQLSGGQQQRVALARALAVEPRVLLLDEPLSALDAKVRTQLRDEIRRLQQRLRLTTLFVTHDQAEALSVADRVGVMRDGRLEQIASPDELYHRPATAFVGEFVGTMNRVPGRMLGPDTVEVLGVVRRVAAGESPRLTDEAVTVLVRPEAVTLTKDDQGPDLVVVRTFQGALTRVSVRLANGDEIRADLPSPAAADLAPGGTVTVSLGDAPVLIG